MNIYTDEPLFNGKSFIVDTKGKSWEGDQDNLQSQDDEDNKREEIVLSDSTEDIKFLMQFSGIEEIKDL